MSYEVDGLASLALAIGIIGALLCGILWALRRAQPRATMWGAADCQVIRSIALGPRERLFVVRVGAKDLVLGVGAAGVSLLCELNEPMPLASPVNARFSEAVRNALKQLHGE